MNPYIEKSTDTPPCKWATPERQHMVIFASRTYTEYRHASGRVEVEIHRKKRDPYATER